MANQPGRQFGRQKNDEKLRTYVRDSENSLLFAPNDYTGNKFIGNGFNYISNLNMHMLYEPQEKYINKFSTRLKAEAESESLPKCFSQCITDISPGLNANEKNCMRECYFKRVSTRDDMLIYF